MGGRGGGANFYRFRRFFVSSAPADVLMKKFLCTYTKYGMRTFMKKIRNGRVHDLGVNRTRPRGYKFLMPYSAETKLYPAHVC